MVTRLKDVDAVTVGFGWTGAILARELTKAGLNVVGLERGPDRVPGEDFILPSVRDEVKYGQRLELMMDNSIDTITFRNFPDEQALPIRRIGAFLPGEGTGGSGIHWGALLWRNLPSDFRIHAQGIHSVEAHVLEIARLLIYPNRRRRNPMREFSGFHHSPHQ